MGQIWILIVVGVKSRLDVSSAEARTPARSGADALLSGSLRIGFEEFLRSP